jgi:hypothetical protein
MLNVEITFHNPDAEKQVKDGLTDMRLPFAEHITPEGRPGVLVPCSGDAAVASLKTELSEIGGIQVQTLETADPSPSATQTIGAGGSRMPKPRRPGIDPRNVIP